MSQRNETLKKSYNEKLSQFVEKAMRQESSIDYNFDTLNYVSVLTSEDKKLRILTWVLKKNDGTYTYYGFVQSYVKNTKSYKISKLNDLTPRLRRSSSKNLSPKKWLGAYYYRIIQNKSGNKTLYTLLGWKGFDKVKSMKVIEVATIRTNGDVLFGYPMFNIKDYTYFKDKRARRLVFTYSARSKMLLSYDVQSVHIEKKTKKKKKSSQQKGFTAQNKEVVEKVRVKTITKPMIIMDRLEPINPEMEGVFEFYLPETNLVDALIFEGNKWKYYPDVDARNKPEEDKPGQPKRPLNYELF